MVVVVVVVGVVIDVVANVATALVFDCDVVALAPAPAAGNATDSASVCPSLPVVPVPAAHGHCVVGLALLT